MRKQAPETPVIFFDGVCNLCNGFVDFVVERDPKKNFRFASLQGETAKKTLPLPFTSSLNSVVLWQDGRTYTESDAVLRIFARIRAPWPMMGLFFVIPRFIRDSVYRFVAKHRYRIFGKRETCRLPTPEERGLFLD